MDKVYDASGFRASKNINVAEYFKKYSVICPPAKETALENFLDFTEDVYLSDSGVDFGILEATCNHENLRLADEPPNLPMSIPDKVHTKMKFDQYYPITDQARKLNVIISKETLEMRWTDQEFKFHGKRFIKDKELIVSEPFKKQNNVKPGIDFLFSILIYKPRTIHQGQRHSAEKLRFAYEIEALGGNFLSQIVDAIECISDSAVIKEVENTAVNLAQFQKAKKLYPSQTVFVDGVFYNDSRMPDWIDLSPEVIKWAKEKNIGKFTTAKMQETLLSSLSPRLGFPYVYIHQGDCEHIFVFSDVRLVQNSDCLDTQGYPKVVSCNRASNILCLLCAMRVCRWMVTECDRFPQERVFLCTECCNSYLYVDGKKVTEFKLYPYYDQEKMRN